MHQHIFVNLPVADLAKSMEFFRAMGYKFNLQFSDDTGACLLLGDNLYAMLLTHEKFNSFPPKEICDTRRSAAVLTCLSCGSRAEVDEVVDKAIAAGGKTWEEPRDYGFMYGRAFTDLDGHIWEYIWMDPTAVDENAQVE